MDEAERKRWGPITWVVDVSRRLTWPGRVVVLAVVVAWALLAVWVTFAYVLAGYDGIGPFPLE